MRWVSALEARNGAKYKVTLPQFRIGSAVCGYNCNYDHKINELVLTNNGESIVKIDDKISEYGVADICGVCVALYVFVLCGSLGV